MTIKRLVGQLRRKAGHYLRALASKVDPSRVCVAFDIESHPDSVLQRRFVREGVTNPIGVMSRDQQVAHIGAGIAHYERLAEEYRRMARAEQTLQKRAPQLYADQKPNS